MKAMNQVSNSLLTLLSTPFKMATSVWAPRDNALACSRHFTPFFAFPGIAAFCGALSLGISCPLRSLVHSRLGEGRIRNLFHGIRFVFVALIAVFLAESFAPAAEGLIRNERENAVVEPARAIMADEIAALIKAYLQNATSWKESEIAIGSIGNLNGIEIPPAGSQLRIASAAPLMGQKHISIPIEVMHGEKILRSFWASAEVCIRAEILTAAQRIPFGKVIGSEDIVQKGMEISDLRASYFNTPGEILGRVARRAFSPGENLPQVSFEQPPLVKQGETVRLRLERDGIVLTSLVKAEQDGKLGQLIRVRNIDFSSLLMAQVTGRAEVKMK